MPGDWAAPLEGCAAEPEQNLAICLALVGGHRAPPPTLEPSVLISLSAGCCRFAPVCCLSAARPSRTQPPCLRQKREHSRNGTVAARVFSRSVSSNVIMLEVVEGFVFFLVFFSCRHRVRLGHRDLANFLRAVAEACSPQRFREENAVVRFISLS